MKKLVSSILSLTMVAGVSFSLVGLANAADYPLKPPVEQEWSFAGPFGTYDKGQLQRGLKVYKEVCAACHSMDLVSFRTLRDLGYSEEQVKALAAEYEIEDGPDANGDMYNRKAVASDHFPSPYANSAAAAASNNGAAPPDLSLIAKARGVHRGFPQFAIDMIPVVGGYQEGGPDYIHALLTGYEDAPAGYEVAEGTYYNPYFASGTSLAMAAPISDDQVTYDDGTIQTTDQYAKDVSAFLMWTAEPHLEDRKKMGFMVLLFLMVFAILIYLTKKSIYSNKEH